MKISPNTPTHRRRSSTPPPTSLHPKKTPLSLPSQCDAFELQIIDFVKSFTTDISQSIAMNEVLFKNNLPQRCLKHNNVLTLYCQKDRLPLCVNCMYQSSEHKNHKVIPLKNASKNILTDTQNFTNKIQRRIEEIDHILRISTENILKIEKIYPEVCSRIELGFKQLHETLHRKQEQHIKDLYLVTEKLRSNHLVLIDELTKLINLFVDKTSIKPDLNDDETNIYTRSILATILESPKYIHIDVKPIEFNLYPHYSSAMFMEVQGVVLEKLQVKKFPTVIVLNQQYVGEGGLGRLGGGSVAGGGENSENGGGGKEETGSKLSKSQIMARFKGGGRGLSPLNSARRR